MATSFKINHEFGSEKTPATIDLTDLETHHRYGSYSKSTLNVHRNASVSQRIDTAHKGAGNDSTLSMDSINSEQLNRSPCCSKYCSFLSVISYHLPILHPFGPFRCFWDFLVMIMLIYTCVEVPVTLAFNVELELNSLSGVASFTIDILLLIDILITFRTAYFDKFDRLRLIIDECSIAQRYIFGWFFIDLLTSIPFEFMFLSHNGSNIVFFVKMLRIFRFIRIIKILRLFKMIKYFDGFMSQFVIRELLLGLKFLKIFALMVLFAHICACCWFFVGYNTMENESGSWITRIISTDKHEVDAESVFNLYSYAWYWAVVTLFTTGYGDITATHGNKAEQWLVSICILIGTCFFAYFIGTLTSLITEGDRIKSVEIQKLEEAQAFCDQKKLPRELSRAVLTHIRYHCGYNYVFDENELIESLPPYLQNDIHSYLAQTILLQFSFLSHLNAQILGQISLKMRSISCNENYCLFKRGDRAKDIYIQRTGESRIDFHDGSTVNVKRGHIIGETSCISPKRKITVTCDTFSEFYVLCVQDIISILQTEYPTTWIKRWKKIVKSLKREIKKKGKTYQRFVDFNKHKKRSKKHEKNKKDDKKLAMKEKIDKSNSLKQWINAGSTIHKTEHIKSVQLNAFGEVDTPTMVKRDDTIYDKNPFQFAVDHGSKKEEAEDDNDEIIEPLPKLIGKSRSDPVPTMRSDGAPSIENDDDDDGGGDLKKKKSLRFGGIFIKRNSVDRDYAIHRSAKKSAVFKRHKSETIISNTEKLRNSFYDISSSKDSSDDSADIVPLDYGDDDDSDDSDDDDKNEKTQHHHDILDGVENLDKLYKKRKQKRVKFSQILNDDDDYGTRGRRQSPSPPMVGKAPTKRSVTTSSGGRKGGKFGGTKRRIHKTSQQKRANIHHVTSPPSRSSKILQKRHRASDSNKNNENNALMQEANHRIPGLSEQITTSVEIIYDQENTKKSEENENGLIVVSHYSDNDDDDGDIDKNTHPVIENMDSTKL